MLSVKGFYKILLSASCFFTGYNIQAQTIYADSSFKNNRVKNIKHVVEAPVILIGAGILLNGNREEGFKKEIAEERNEYFPKFTTSVDDYLQYAPIGMAYALDAFGCKSKTDIKNRTVILFKSELAMSGLVVFLKKITHQLRPDNSSYNSFPSGHTAQAFAAATFLNEEYKGSIKWMPYAAYGMATTVGLLRMANNKHYISDVLVGAGIGILTTKLAYLTHQYKWGKKSITTTPTF